MQSKAKDVAEYLDEQSDEVRPVLKKLRALVRKSVPAAQESMRFGMPTYEVEGTSLCSFAVQKGYLAFYMCDTELVAKFRAELGTKDCGKSCIRYRKPDAIPLPVIAEMLAAAVKRGPEHWKM
ncbi:MAG TPA: DUF1801 domain-containing protein [Thermoanaerobaculia bacterium]|nr:DUF1801 domain-containing protein [Thermoanaerobaculia bacterium]